MQEEFVSIGLTAKAASEVANNAALAAELRRVIALAGPKSKGLKILHEFAVENTNGSFGDHGGAVLKYILADQITSSKQIKAAIKFIKAHKQIEDVHAFEKSCGIGVVVSEAELKASIAKAIETNSAVLTERKWGALGQVMKDVSAAHEFADGNQIKTLVQQALEAKLGPQQEEKKEKKAVAVVEAKAAVEEVVEKPNLPFHHIRVHTIAHHVGQRVLIQGWVHELRVQSKLVFLVLRDAGSGFVQVILSGKLAKTKAAQELRRESSVRVYGIVTKVPEGQTAEHGVELQADYMEVTGLAMGDVEQIVNKDCSDEIKADQRHLLLRGRRLSAYLRLRSLTMHCMRSHFMDHRYYEVTPPTLVQTACEGGSDLFAFDFFGEPAYLTQSSQLYLETVIPTVGKTFCILPSFRAEKSRTRRHLAEYTHLEAELPWITFDDLMNAMEELIVNTIERIMANHEAKELLEFVNPGFKAPKRPFRRMSYTEAVKYCQDHNIFKLDDTGKPIPGAHYQFGDDLPEAAERSILADIDEPIFMNKFPVPLKAFYMAKTKEDPTLTESVDLLLPGVGEVIGGSMRISDFDELMAAYQREKLDPSPYAYYTDQRKFGTVPHGGYGLGVERFLVYLFGDDHIRNVCLYPRYKNRCKP